MAPVASIDDMSERLMGTLPVDACWFEPFPFDEQLPRIETGRIVLPAEEPGVAPWQGRGGVELPVRSRGLTLGRFVLIPAEPTCGVSLPPSARARAIEIAEEFADGFARSLI